MRRRKRGISHIGETRNEGKNELQVNKTKMKKMTHQPQSNRGNWKRGKERVTVNGDEVDENEASALVKQEKLVMGERMSLKQMR